MNRFLFFALAATAANLLGQQTDFPEVERQLQELQLRTPEIHIDSAELERSLAELNSQAALIAQSVDASGVFDRHDSHYEAGTRDLDHHQYDSAIRNFDNVISHKGAHADGATYWKAYAEARSGHRTEALATLAALRRDYPKSLWLTDAGSLQAEIHSGEGKPADSGAENDDLKLIALNGIMQSDPGRAVPILRNVLHGAQSPGVRDRALFVLSQSSSPEAHELLLDVARGKTDPDLQIKAIRYLAMLGDRKATGELGQIYAGTSDLEVKKAILRSYLLSHSKTELLEAAKGEGNVSLREIAIQTLAQTGAKEELWALYQKEPSPAIRERIVHSMLLNGDTAHLLEIAKTEKDPSVRKKAIQTLALTGGNHVGAPLEALYRNESDTAVKRELIHAMFLSENSHALIELARAEKNPNLRREMVQQLSLMHSKEVTDYLLEIVK